MSKKRLRATTLQYIFISIIIIMVIGSIVGFTYLNTLLEENEQRADHTEIDAKIEQSTLTTLQTMENRLEQDQEIVERAESIVADSREYQYQDQIVEDIDTYANRAGVNVIGYDFASTEGEPVQGVEGLFAMEATITLSSPVSYENFLRFLKHIEQNLTKMQITGVNLSPDIDDRNNISNPSIGLQIFVRGSN